MKAIKLILINLLMLAQLSLGVITPNTTNYAHSTQTHVTTIGQSDISNGKTLTISTPGHYVLTRNLVFVPDAASDTIINITTNDVTIDFGTHTIYSNKALAGTKAINIATGLSNITILNGTIKGMTGVGIYVNSSCRNVHVSNMIIMDCDEGGLSLNSSDHLYVTNCVINKCNGSSSTSDATALRATSCKHLTATNSEFSINTGTAKPGIGVLLTGCTGASFTNCTAAHNTGTAAYGFQLNSSCSDCHFENCHTSGLTSTAGDVSGFDLNTAPNNRLINCQAHSSTAVGGICSGFSSDAGSGANIFHECHAMSNTSDTNTYIFYIASNGNELINCKANLNTSTGGDMVGYYLVAAESNLFKNCIANRNSTSSGNVNGFLLAAADSNQLTRCTALTNTTSAQNKYAAGFNSIAGTSNTFERCIASNQNCSHVTGGTSSTTVTQYAAGFILQDGEDRTKLFNCKANCNNGGNGYGIGFGIYLRGDGIITNLADTSAPTNTIIQSCRMEFNTSTGTSSYQGNKYGFLDERQDTTSVLINNVSVGHGRCVSTLDTSYNFVDPFTTGTTPIGMNYMFYHTGTDENPANMIHETDIFNWTTLSTSVPDWMNVSIVTGQLALVS